MSYLLIERYREIMASHGLRGFDRIPWINPETEQPDKRVLGYPIPMRWRVSPDELTALKAVAVEMFPDLDADPTLPVRMFGYDLIVDDQLPSGSVVFERTNG